MKNKTYIISYRVIDNPNYEYEEEYTSRNKAIKRVIFIQKEYEIDGTITVSDDKGALVEID